MNKKKILFGIFMALMISVSGLILGLKNDLSSVFAVETEQQQIVSKAMRNSEMGSVSGEGWYQLGDTASLSATANPGWKFVGWWYKEAEDAEEQLLSNESEYTFVVSKAIYITARFEKVVYEVLWQDEDLATDFDLSVKNNTLDGKVLNYNDEVVVTINSKTATTNQYIHDLTLDNITINGLSLVEILDGDNEMGIICDVTTDDTTGITNNVGFEKAVIKFHILDNIKIDINYDYLYKLSIVSGNAYSIEDLIEFIDLTNIYSRLGEEGYVYLVKQDQDVIINMGQGNSVYKFEYAQMEAEANVNTQYSQAYILSSDKTFSVYYSKIPYNITFSTYLKNEYENYDLIDIGLYSINSIQLIAGQSETISYNNENKQIKVGETTYSYCPTGAIYGYKFVGFSIDNDYTKIKAEELTFEQGATNPSEHNIQVLFEKIEYEIEVQFIDEFFSEDVNYELTVEGGKLTCDATVTVNAVSDKHIIKGWKYLNKDATEYTSTDSSYAFTFKPTSDNTDNPYVMYLDVDYKYYETKYSLNNSNIEKLLDYDTVKVDLISKKLVFIDSFGDNVQQEITFTDADITTEDSIVTINTQSSFGEVEINNASEQLTFGDKTQYSISKVTEQGVDIYQFNKYNYMGELKLVLIDYFKLTDTHIEIYGRNSDNINMASGLIKSLPYASAYDSEKLADKLTFGYTAYLYKNGLNYNYINFGGVNFYYDSDSAIFTPKHAINKQAEQLNFVKNSEYQFTVSNLTLNSLILYMSTSTVPLSYQFLNYTNASGASLASIEIEQDSKMYHSSILNIDNLNIMANYIKLEKDVRFLISDMNAYTSYNDVKYTKSTNPSSIYMGDKVSATAGTSINVWIDKTLIKPGYQFNGFKLNGQEEYLSTESNFTFIMSVDYIDETIVLDFSAIQYSFQVNYLDEAGQIIADYSTLKGSFKVDTNTGAETYINETLSVVKVGINQIYAFTAIANTGYYVNEAYIGTKSFMLNSLMVDNSSATTITSWTLNADNFINAIIANANMNNEVQLYIQFKIHTYDIKVYFEIGANKTAISYPDLIANGQYYKVNQEQDTGNFVAIVEGLDYGTEVNLSLGEIMKGIKLDGWHDKDGKNIGNALATFNIDENKVYSVKLGYKGYTIQFISQDIGGNDKVLGAGNLSENRPYRLFESVYFTITPSAGYVLKSVYYYDNTQTKQEGLESGFTWQPAKYYVQDNKFVIYMVFDLKKININITNSKTADSSNLLDKPETKWATHEILRSRGNTTETLEPASSYEFQTGDLLTLIIKPISIGIELYKATFGTENNKDDISFSSGSPYSLNYIQITKNDQVESEQYRLQIVFNPSFIANLEDALTIDNVFKLKKYDLTYTYNWKTSYPIGLRLMVNNSITGRQTLAKDTDYTTLLEFGTQITFQYLSSSLEADKYNVVGFKLNETLYENVTLPFSALGTYANAKEVWEELGLYSCNKNNNKIKVQLMLSTRITLHNYDKDNPNKYTRTYIGQEQGLVAGEDVKVGGGFTPIIRYNGKDKQPIDAGVYNVTIHVQVTQGITLKYDKEVAYVIIPKSVTLKTNYSASNPLTKVYDGTNSVKTTELLNNIIIDGLFERDKQSISIDRTRGFNAVYSSSLASKTGVYDITVYNLYLVDNGTGEEPLNYTLDFAPENSPFRAIGKITPKELRIAGFSVANKVYDGTGEVVVDTSEIRYIGVVNADSAKISTENLRFYCEVFTAGSKREVILDHSKALDGADSANYTIVYDPVYIDIHPRELEVTIDDYGTFKLVDEERLCLIPIGAELMVNIYTSDTYIYKQLYATVEQFMKQGENFSICYDFTLRTGVTTSKIPTGLYLYMPNSAKLSKVIQCSDNVDNLEYNIKDGFVVVYVEQIGATMCIINYTTYLPLWLIILIVVVAVVVIGALVVLFIIIRRKQKQKYKGNDRI